MDDSLLRGLVGLAGVPFIVGLTQLVKPFVTDTRFYAPVSVGWGLAINIGLAFALGMASGTGLAEAVFLGLLAGLAASGLYSAGATMTEGPQADKAKRGSVPPSPPGR